MTDLRVGDVHTANTTGGRLSHSALTLLRDCVGLQRLTLECVSERDSSSADLAKQLYLKGHALFDTYGASRDRKDAILDILVVRVHNKTGYHDMDDKSKVDFQDAMRKLFLS